MTGKKKTRISLSSENREGLFAALIVVSMIGVLYFYRINLWLVNDDEGSFLYQVWRMTVGERPYVDFLSSRDPLFLYSGALWMQIWGPSIIAMRGLATAMTIGTAYLVYLLAVQTSTPRTGLIAAVTFLLHPQVVNYGRMFQPEPFFLFFLVAAMVVLQYALDRKKPLLLTLSSLLFAVSSLYKLLAILGFFGCVLYFVVITIRKKASARDALVDGLLLVSPFTFIFVATWLVFLRFVPGFFEGVVSVNVTQSGIPSATEMVLHILGLFVAYSLEYLPLLLGALPVAIDSWLGKRNLLAAWQLPTSLGFAILSRALFPRLLYYLAPSLSVLFAIVVEPLWCLAGQRRYHFLFVAMLLMPWMMQDASLFNREEHSTMTVSEYISSITDSDDYIVSDYQELNFYAQRASTFLGSEISYVIIEDGTITADLLIEEIEAVAAKLILLDTSPATAHQLLQLQDYKTFKVYLDQNYDLLQTFPREDQQISVFQRKPGRPER